MEGKQFDFFKGIVTEVYRKSGIDFAGLGLIFYKELQGLPLNPLRLSPPEEIILPVSGQDAIVETILILNKKKSLYHDGFHLVSKEMMLTDICQYFSPPIQTNTSIDYTKGGRFRAGQYGSYLKNIFAVAVIGEEYGPFIFINGKTYQL